MVQICHSHPAACCASQYIDNFASCITNNDKSTLKVEYLSTEFYGGCGYGTIAIISNTTDLMFSFCLTPASNITATPTWFGYYYYYINACDAMWQDWFNVTCL